MPTREDYLRQPRERRLARLAGTADELTEAIRNRSAAELARRPDSASWSATEIICHLRDVEELFRIRFHTILALDDPKILTFSAEPAALGDWVASLAAHDDNHLAQLARAIEGRG